jgi:hypothetical protein
MSCPSIMTTNSKTSAVSSAGPSQGRNKEPRKRLAGNNCNNVLSRYPKCVYGIQRSSHNRCLQPHTMKTTSIQSGEDIKCRTSESLQNWYSDMTAGGRRPCQQRRCWWSVVEWSVCWHTGNTMNKMSPRDVLNNMDKMNSTNCTNRIPVSMRK